MKIKKCMLGFWNSLNHFDKNQFDLFYQFYQEEKVYGSSPYSPNSLIVII